MTEDDNWDLVIKPKNKWYQLDISSIWHYRDLMWLLVRRDFVSIYKQTIFGPLWYVVQPLLTSLTYTLLIGGMAKISTSGIPPMVFYMGGLAIWTYFSDCFTRTSSTFISNANIFGKVYFPRLVMPLSVLFSTFFKFLIQFIIFLAIWIYYIYTTSGRIHPQWTYLLFLPALVLMMAGLGLGFGILISSLTTKYRDLTFLIGFGVQLLMWASCVFFPLSIASPKARFILLLNPFTSIIESFRFMFFGSGQFLGTWLLYSAGFMLVFGFIAVVVFNKVEKTFMDTV